ncbi:DHH family phosphoesterase [Salibacterium halotolerans]|uniref:Phosphoesterase RecJ domain-containing protein n=1 Tax=Salibacterium halotolerans TaxID=1884432 RepID=A0A1I5VH50_9BACI|nr:bifunctional oligoribonuclease/PAP phosphatase NrnA [Salibacterium halotolerans]SFQ06825.1 phosphoesterase RecJ domain-containing protein [Salibacterium halotolerans]
MKQTILQTIERYSVIGVYRHEKPDPDALGSQGGLAALIQHNYPEKTVCTIGEDEPSLSFLTEMTGTEETLTSSDGFLVIVCDTANTERIDGQMWHAADYVVKIDHHPEVEVYGQDSWVSTDASSTSEMVIDLFLTAREEKGWEMTTEAARLLYAGIVGDTGRFQFSNTTPDTLRLAAEALRFPFDPTELFTRFYESEEKLVRLKGEVLQQFELSPEGVGVARLTKEMLERYDISINESSALVNSFSETKGLKAWVFFVEQEEYYRVRLRSKGPAIHHIAAAHNGGGHPMASGAKAVDEQEVQAVIQELKELCREYES